ncbi:MAG: hypothetical protein ABIW76_15780 [Fibrobacteria bacterium]
MLGFVTGLADSNHSVLIRALLDRESLPVSSGGCDFSGLSAGPSAYAMVQDRIERIREESFAKFLEFRDKWRKRLAFVQLHPFLQRNQWFQQEIGGYSLVGKGTRKEAKMLYLQSLHDMASDGERQVSALSGHMFRLQGELASVWHRESVTDDRSKLLPALESALRAGEAELFKRLRLSLSDLALETFTERVGKWEKRIYGTEEDLFRGIAWPWQSARYRSGFEGFMETFADLAESICGAMLAHYEGKWNLMLRGLSPLRLPSFPRLSAPQVSAVPQVPARSGAVSPASPAP